MRDYDIRCDWIPGHSIFLGNQLADQNANLGKNMTLAGLKEDAFHKSEAQGYWKGAEVDKHPLICGVGLGGFWAERIGFLCGIRQVIFNPNLYPEEHMQGKIDRPEEYRDIATKCVEDFREKNRDRCLAVLSRHDEVLDSQRSAELLHKYYEIVWDEQQTHKFKNISPHLQRIKAFKTLL